MKRDDELFRLEGILNGFDDLEDRFFKLNRKHGPGAESRAAQYIKSRRSWFFRRFENL